MPSSGREGLVHPPPAAAARAGDEAQAQARRAGSCRSSGCCAPCAACAARSSTCSACAEVRRIERRLIGEYRAIVAQALDAMTPATRASSCRARRAAGRDPRLRGDQAALGEALRDDRGAPGEEARPGGLARSCGLNPERASCSQPRGRDTSEVPAAASRRTSRALSRARRRAARSGPTASHAIGRPPYVALSVKWMNTRLPSTAESWTSPRRSGRNLNRRRNASLRRRG